MNYIARLLIWTSSAGLGMFAVYAWWPEWIGAVGVLTGFLCILIVEKFVPPKSFIKDVSLFGIFICTTALSYLMLLLACIYLPGINRCGERAKESFLLSIILYPAVSIIPIYILVWLPRHFRNWLQK